MLWTLAATVSGASACLPDRVSALGLTQSPAGPSRQREGKDVPEKGVSPLKTLVTELESPQPGCSFAGMPTHGQCGISNGRGEVLRWRADSNLL